MEQRDEVWVLGATGRTGQRAAAVLVERGVRTVLVGRNAARLDVAAAETGAASTLTAEDPTFMAAAIRERHPAVVVNTVGPFSATSALFAEACLPASSYVDLANDMASAAAITDLHESARRHGRTLVTGAGFGVVGTEAPLTLLHKGRPTPTSVRVDSVASLSIPAGALGQALTDSIVEMFTATGQRVINGDSPLPRSARLRSLSCFPTGAR